MTRSQLVLFTFVIAASASAQTAPPADPAADSMRLCLLGIETEKAILQAERTDFWHRLVPKVTVSAGWGTREVLFPDPATLYVMGKDSYRLTLSLSVDELLDFNKHSLASLELEKLSVETDETRERLKLARSLLAGALIELDSLIRIASEEQGIRESLFHYVERRFGQGKVAYEELLRSKLDLLGARKALVSLTRRRAELLGKLRAGDEPATPSNSPGIPTP